MLLEKQGLIQAFEYTHELAWNVMKDFFENQGESIPAKYLVSLATFDFENL